MLVDNPDASSPRLAYCFTARGCLFGRPVAPGRRGEARRLAGPKPLLDIYISRSRNRCWISTSLDHIYLM